MAHWQEGSMHLSLLLSLSVFISAVVLIKSKVPTSDVCGKMTKIQLLTSEVMFFLFFRYTLFFTGVLFSIIQLGPFILGH